MQLGLGMIYVKDLPRMSAFYAVVLGCEPVVVTKEWVEFRTAAGAGLALHAIPAQIAEHIEIADPPVVREQTPIKLVFETAGVPAQVARLETAGVVLIHRPWGIYDGLDPEGNVFSIAPIV